MSNQNAIMTLNSASNLGEQRLSFEQQRAEFESKIRRDRTDEQSLEIWYHIFRIIYIYLWEIRIFVQIVQLFLDTILKRCRAHFKISSVLATPNGGWRISVRPTSTSSLRLCDRVSNNFLSRKNTGRIIGISVYGSFTEKMHLEIRWQSFPFCTQRKLGRDLVRLLNCNLRSTWGQSQLTVDSS